MITLNGYEIYKATPNSLPPDDKVHVGMLHIQFA